MGGRLDLIARRGLCRRCDVVLDVYNSTAATLRKGKGACRECKQAESAEWREKRPDSVRAAHTRYQMDKANNPERLAKNRDYRGTIKGRLSYFKCVTRQEDVPDTDILRNEHFYTELIKDNECHYCLGPLAKTGIGLDRMDSNQAHLCFNVVPCCWYCNTLKMHNTSYEEMWLLVPGLREIRRRREEKRWQQSQ